jgi:hypothetical protein
MRGIPIAWGTGLCALAACATPAAPVAVVDIDTEVVLVVDTDLDLPAQGNALLIELRTSTASQFFENSVFLGSVPTGTDVTSLPQPPRLPRLPTFPTFFRLWPSDVGTAPFSVVVSMLSLPPQTQTPTLGVSRTASDVQFVTGEQRALFIALPRACVCTGTSCPALPDCANLSARTLPLPPFDPDHLPRLITLDAGVAAEAAPD